MTPDQITSLRTHLLASVVPAVVAARDARNDTEVARLYNLPSTFVVWRKNIPSDEVGKTVLYNALAAMTSANTARVQLFMDLNKSAFNGSADINTYFQDTFGGALNGSGQATRDALAAMLRRFATVCEGIFTTGTGTTGTPGNLGSFEGSVTISDIGQALNG